MRWDLAGRREKGEARLTVTAVNMNGLKSDCAMCLARSCSGGIQVSIVVLCRGGAAWSGRSFLNGVT